MSEPAAVTRVAVIGGGVIGAGWTARLLLSGLDVSVFDPDPETAGKLETSLQLARRAWRKLGRNGDEGVLTIARELAAAVTGADFIQENTPERLPLKQQVIAEISTHCPAEAIIASSTSGLRPSNLQAECRGPDRFLVGHPFNPVYLMPLVELCGGNQTKTETIDRAEVFYRTIGMAPLRLSREIDGFIADRLMEAMWREALHLINDGIATTAEIDQAVIMGPGLRWAFMGPFLTYVLGGGAGGMGQFMAQFGPTLALPWSKLQGPEMTDELRQRIIEQADAQADGRSAAELQRLRDDCLIEILEGLARQNQGAGKVLNDWRGG